MRIISKKLITLLCLITLMLSTSMTAFASLYNPNSEVTSAQAYENLWLMITTPSYLTGGYAAKIGSNKDDSYFDTLASKEYTAKDGGYVLYSELVPRVGGSNLKPVDETQFNKLTTGSKQKFLQDLFTVANTAATIGQCDSIPSISRYRFDGITSETVQLLYERLEAYEGMGSVLMASIMENTKPDFSSANKIYEPFSGVVGTILGLIAVLIMALLGITMALDIAYITVPTMRLALDAGGQQWHNVNLQTGQETNRFKLSNLVSQAARNAVLEENGGAGIHSLSRETNNHPLGVYFKYRWLELVVLGICLLYLVSGNIYSFVAWILDLVSGFMGF